MEQEAWVTSEEQVMAVRGSQDLRSKLLVLAGVCGAMVLVHVLNMLSGGALSTMGIRPRDPSSLYAIATTPWLHGGLGHLGNNLVMLAALAGLCLLEGVAYFVRASAIILIVSGVLLWLFGRDGVHIGASGWIFGLWSLTIVRAWFQRSYTNIFIALAVILLYGGLAWGMLPSGGSISFEGHIFGALSGVAAAWALHHKAPRATR
jgi:membrane associated rhomboid family serine protease